MNDKKPSASTNGAAKYTRKQLEKSSSSGAVDKSDFNKLLYSVLNIKDDGVSKPDENKPLRIEKKNSKHILDMAVSQTNGWRLSAPANQISLEGKEMNVAESGLSITYCELNVGEDSWQAAKLYIGSQTGKVGINTYNPTAQLHIAQSDNNNDLLKLTLTDSPADQPVIHVDKTGATTINKTVTLNEQLIINNSLKLPGGLVTSVSADKLNGHLEALVTDKVVYDHICGEVNRLQDLVNGKAAKEGDRAQNFNMNDLVATSLNLAEGEKVTAIVKAADLGGTESSDMKIPTQKAVKDYADNLNTAANNKIDTQINQINEEIKKINAESVADLTVRIESKANKQGDGAQDFSSNSLVTNNLVTNNLRLSQGDSVNAIINGSDLGGEHTSHTNLATQQAIKEYIDNAIRNAVFSNRRGMKTLIGQQIFQNKDYRMHSNNIEEIIMPESFSERFSYFINASVCEYKPDSGLPHAGQATLHTYEWYPIDNNKFQVRFRVHDFERGSISAIVIRYFVVGY
jgi:molybdopterin-binding protein